MSQLDHVRLEGEPHDSRGPAFSVDVVDAFYEFPQCEISFRATDFHGLNIGPGITQPPWGVLPMHILRGSRTIDWLEN